MLFNCDILFKTVARKIKLPTTPEKMVEQHNFKAAGYKQYPQSQKMP